MFQQPDGNFVVERDSGFSVSSDVVFLAVGQGASQLTDEENWCRKFAQDHARYNSKLVYIRHPCPLGKLTALASDARVGISGMGLAAHEVAAELTLGLGGRFVAAGSGLRYAASGQEPRLLMFSRKACPLWQARWPRPRLPIRIFLRARRCAPCANRRCASAPACSAISTANCRRC